MLAFDQTTSEPCVPRHVDRYFDINVLELICILRRRCYQERLSGQHPSVSLRQERCNVARLQILRLLPMFMRRACRLVPLVCFPPTRLRLNSSVRGPSEPSGDEIWRESSSQIYETRFLPIQDGTAKHMFRPFMPNSILITFALILSS